MDECAEPSAAQSLAHHRKHLSRGFNWLGGATLIAKLTDFVTIIVVLLFLTKTQLGVGSLILAFGMMVESFDGLGTSEAIVQAEHIDEGHLPSLFWFIIAAAIAVGGLALLISPLLGWTYGIEGFPLYFIPLAAKQPLVGAAVVPLALLNRELKYEKIAAINVATTFGTALIRLALAMAGCGVWALVGAYFVSGVFIAVGAFWIRPFRPSWQFRFSAIRPLVTFGIRSASSNVLEQIFKNIDFLLVGWFYGAAALAIYRVAFDIAMEPAMAVGLLVNRTALPVFSRLATNLALMREALLWALQRLAVLVAPCMAGLALMAVPLLDLLHDAQGRSYAAAALPLQILAAAALLRAASQLIIPVLMGSGRPGTAAKLALATLLLLSGLIVLAGCTAHGPRGSVAVAVAWLAAYPPLLAWDAHYLWRKLEISPLALLRPFLPPGIAIAGMISLVCLFRLSGWVEAPLPRIALAVAATGCAYGGLMCWSRSGKAAATSAL